MAEHIDWDAMFANVRPQDDGEHIEHEKQTCQNCFHYKCCSDFGLVLDPLHGGVICDTFVSTADVAPVVRCKDCKHWVKKDFQSGNDPEHLEYGGMCPGARFARFESDFCSYGERKDGE